MKIKRHAKPWKSVNNNLFFINKGVLNQPLCPSSNSVWLHCFFRGDSSTRTRACGRTWTSSSGGETVEEPREDARHHPHPQQPAPHGEKHFRVIPQLHLLTVKNCQHIHLYINCPCTPCGPFFEWRWLGTTWWKCSWFLQYTSDHNIS